MNLLTTELINAGLLQFGRFGSKESPYRLNLELLPSYPDVLGMIAEEAAAMVETGFYDRLVCTASALPFGVALSLKTDIPLVYSLGSELPGVHDLVGAYDVGHPALLLTNQFPDATALNLVEKAQRVGLEIHDLLTIFRTMMPDSPLRTSALLNLGDVVGNMVTAGRLPKGQAEAVHTWIAGK